MSENVLSLEATARRCRALRANGGRVVLTNGCFDLLHVGHVRYLRKARELGDMLVVAVNSDSSVRALKGRSRPVVPEAERAEVVAALGCVDIATIFPGLDAANLIDELQPDVYVKGGDYGPGRCDMPEARAVDACGATAAFLDYVPGASTTSIIERVVEQAHAALKAAS